MGNPAPLIGKKQEATISFKTTAGAEDKDYLVLYAKDRSIFVNRAYVVFTHLDTFASGADLNLQTDNGTTETEFANYDTVSGTAVATVYDFTVTAAQIVPVGYWLQLQVDHDEDAATGGVVTVEYWEV